MLSRRVIHGRRTTENMRVGGDMTEMRDLRLPADICAAAEKKFGHVFPSVEELLAFVLRDFSREDSSIADRAEQRLVEERLRELGYL